MSKKRLKWITIAVLITVIISIVAAAIIYPMETLANQTTFIITVLSLVISLLAFIIAILTYTSIDSVDNVTKMEGNVLENEYYVTSLTEILEKYAGDDPNKTRKAIFNDLEKKFTKESKTAVAFANNLQYFIDLIVIFPLFYKTKAEKQENLKAINEILNKIDQRKKDLLEVSRGNLVLIEETVKLIQAVMSYQAFTATEKTSEKTEILSVRGSMLKNAVTRTVYYNYLGLFYNKKAMSLIRTMLEIDDFDLLSIRSLRKIYNQTQHIQKDENLQLLNIYLRESIKAFDEALINGESDLMWVGFIKYNKARTTYFYERFFNDSEYDWEAEMEEAIIARMQLNYLLKDLMLQRSSYLQEEFIYQEQLARLVNHNIRIAMNEHKGNKVVKEEILKESIFSEAYNGPSDKVREYRTEIIEALKTTDK